MTETDESSTSSKSFSVPTKKSSNAFLTISEVSSQLELPQHVLRFWETKFDAVKPMKRGGGRRYYRPKDVECLKQIQNLLYFDGYTIKGVQKLIRENGGKLPENTSTSEQNNSLKTKTSSNYDLAELQEILSELEQIQTDLNNNCN